jgi:transcriptional regulator with XRE-family HTH domain
MNVEDSLRARREALGLTATELAARVGCPVETVLRAEFGVQVPHERRLLARLAGAYGLSGEAYARLALDAAERSVEGSSGLL